METTILGHRACLEVVEAITVKAAAELPQRADRTTFLLCI